MLPEFRFDGSGDIAHADIQCRADAVKGFERRLSLSAFDGAEMASGNARKSAQNLLRESRFFPISRKNTSDQHRIKNRLIHFHHPS